MHNMVNNHVFLVFLKSSLAENSISNLSLHFILK